MIRPFLLLLTVTGLLTTCSSGNTALRRGKFDRAVKRASQRLQQKPGLSKRGHVLAPLVLKEAFGRAYEGHQAAIRRLSSATTDTFRWEAVYVKYGQLQTLTNDARRGCAACLDWLAAYPASFGNRLDETRALAAADRYEAAEQAFLHREENRLAAKDAYLNYRKAAAWVPGYRQARAKAEDALPFAILRVVVEPLSPTGEISPGDNRELQELIFRQIRRKDAPSTFVRLYPSDETADEATAPAEMGPGLDWLSGRPGDGYPIHQAVQMQVTEYSPHDERTSSSSTTVYSNQEYKVGEKKLNDSTTVDILEKVTGTLTTYRKEISAGLTLRMRAVDTQTGRERWHDSVWESRSWATEWQTFSGDDRALNGQSLKRADPFTPWRGSFYASMRDELADDVARRLRSRYVKD